MSVTTSLTPVKTAIIRDAIEIYEKHWEQKIAEDLAQRDEYVEARMKSKVLWIFKRKQTEEARREFENEYDYYAIGPYANRYFYQGIVRKYRYMIDYAEDGIAYLSNDDMKILSWLE